MYPGVVIERHAYLSYKILVLLMCNNENTEWIYIQIQHTLSGFVADTHAQNRSNASDIPSKIAGSC